MGQVFRMGSQATVHQKVIPISGNLPSELVAVRHGQSVANVVFSQTASQDIADAIVEGSDADVPLSVKGRHQSLKLGCWFAGAEERLPDTVVCSPFRRAQETVHIALSQLPPRAVPEVRVDARLADRDMGVLELMAPAAIARDHPEETARRRELGEMRYKPPGGESMADVATRVRRFLSDLSQAADSRRVLVVGHDAIVLMMRFVIEGLREQDIWDNASANPVANGSMTCWRSVAGRLVLRDYNNVAHLT
jgi:2,3-bisphosphoglycerate-dependent phosphoglycerate mutase